MLLVVYVHVRMYVRLSVHLFIPIQNDINIDCACSKCIGEAIKLVG